MRTQKFQLLEELFLSRSLLLLRTRLSCYCLLLSTHLLRSFLFRGFFSSFLLIFDILNCGTQFCVPLGVARAAGDDVVDAAAVLSKCSQLLHQIGAGSRCFLLLFTGSFDGLLLLNLNHFLCLWLAHLFSRCSHHLRSCLSN